MSRPDLVRALALLGCSLGLVAGGMVSAAPASASSEATAHQLGSWPAGSPLPRADLPALCRLQQRIVCVAKNERTLRYLESGTEWLTAEVRFGRVGYETPTGTWSIATKDPSSWWSYPYKVFMPWGMKFDTTDGLYIHYSSGFALNPQGYIGSHGCVQLGDWETARKLYERVPVNTTVHIY